jgi:hypothetical protein
MFGRMKITSTCILSSVWISLGCLVTAQVASTNSAATPYDLSITAPVQVASSDAAAAAFQSNVLPGLLDTVLQRLPDKQKLSNSQVTAMSLDPAQLMLSADASARVYFLGQDKNYNNPVGISTTGGGPMSPDAAWVFLGAANTNQNPLAPGDFVDLGNFTAGTRLDFFLLANGTNNGTFFSTNQSLNKDGIIHAVTLSPNGSAYLILGFESTINGGDRDYNDFLLAVEIKPSQVTGVAAPEPSLAFGAALSGLALFGCSRRRRKSVAS